MKNFVGASLLISLGLVLAAGCALSDYESAPETAGGQGGAGNGAGGGGNGSGGGVTGVGGGAGGGAGGGGVCQAGSACYGAPEWTLGKGACTGGTQVCDANGAFSACDGEVLPKPESCQFANSDLNCDGYTGCKGDGIDATSKSSEKDDIIYAIDVHHGFVGYAVGLQEGALDGEGNPTGGKPLVARREADGTLTDWSSKISLINGTLAYATDVAVGPHGQVAIVGNFNGQVKIGDTTYSSAGGRDIFLAVFTSSGDVVFARTFGDAAEQFVRAVECDENDNVYIAGGYQGTLAFDSNTASASGEADAFVAAFSSDGVFQWTRRLGGAGWQADYDLAAPGDGTLIVAGNFKGFTNLDGQGFDPGDVDFYLQRLDTANKGAVLWARPIATLAEQLLTRIAVSPSGEIAATGGFRGTLGLGNGSDLQNFELSPAMDAFVAFFSVGTGSTIRSIGLGSEGLQLGTSVAFDPSGDLLVAGAFSGTLPVGESVGQDLALTSSGGADAFVVKYAGGSTTPLWAERFGDESEQVAHAVDATAIFGHPVVGGTFMGELSDAPGAPVSAGARDAFVIELSP